MIEQVWHVILHFEVLKRFLSCKWLSFSYSFKSFIAAYYFGGCSFVVCLQVSKGRGGLSCLTPSSLLWGMSTPPLGSVPLSPIILKYSTPSRLPLFLVQYGCWVTSDLRGVPGYGQNWTQVDIFLPSLTIPYFANIKALISCLVFSLRELISIINAKFPQILFWVESIKKWNVQRTYKSSPLVWVMVC